MAHTTINGKEQIRDASINLGKLDLDFLDSADWDINNGNIIDPGTITGVPDPVNPLDVVNKQFLQSFISSGEGTNAIGAAEDADYTDGLFTDFSPVTPVGTAVDRFNEILKALAPAPAPNLTTATSANSGVAGKLSFDASHPISGVTNHASQLINTLVTVAGDVRGIINDSTSVTGTLASNVTPSYTNSRPYPNNAFGDADKGLLHLEVNGVNVQTVTLSTFASGNSFNGAGSGFTLSAPTSVKFDNGNSLDLFKYRTGTLIVTGTSMVPGYNTVRVRHEYATGLFRSTSLVSWIVDNNTTLTSYEVGSFGTLAMAGSRYLSGVRYHTSGTAAFGTTIHNAYKNTYSSSASAISFNGTNCAIPAQAIPAMASYTDDIVLSGKTATINASRILNASISVTVSTLRTIQQTITSAASSISNILLDSTAADATNANDSFNDEGFRLNNSIVITNTSYGSGGAAASAYTWDSTQNLMTGNANHNTGLLVSNSELTYPKNTSHISTVTTGNFSAATNGYTLNPDYTLSSGNRTYLRYFYDAASRSNFRFNVTATGTTFVPLTTGVSGQNLTFEVLAPNTTSQGGIPEWKDGVVAYTTQNGIGMYAGTFGNTIPTNWGMTLGPVNTSTSGKVIVVRITAAPAWTGKISNIALTWL